MLFLFCALHADGISPATVVQLIAIVHDEDDTARLRLELAAMIDIGKHLVCATYNLEGDGLLAFSAYFTLQAVASAFSELHCPTLAAVASEIAGETSLKQQFWKRIRFAKPDQQLAGLSKSLMLLSDPQAWHSKLHRSLILCTSRQRLSTLTEWKP